MRLVDTLLSFPVLLLALTISAMLGPSIPNAIIAIGVAFTPFLARIVRGEALRVTQMPYVEAARAAGATDLNLILRHVAPNVMPPIIVQATISLAFAVLAEASLSFLGLGTQPPQSSWGLMIQASRDYLDVAPWTGLVPGAAVAVTVLGLNMSGDILRDVSIRGRGEAQRSNVVEPPSLFSHRKLTPRGRSSRSTICGSNSRPMAGRSSPWTASRFRSTRVRRSA